MVKYERFQKQLRKAEGCGYKIVDSKFKNVSQHYFTDGTCKIVSSEFQDNMDLQQLLFHIRDDSNYFLIFFSLQLYES